MDLNPLKVDERVYRRLETGRRHFEHQHPFGAKRGYCSNGGPTRMLDRRPQLVKIHQEGNAGGVKKIKKGSLLACMETNNQAHGIVPAKC